MFAKLLALSVLVQTGKQSGILLIKVIVGVTRLIVGVEGESLAQALALGLTRVGRPLVRRVRLVVRVEEVALFGELEAEVRRRRRLLLRRRVLVLESGQRWLR